MNVRQLTQALPRIIRTSHSLQYVTGNTVLLFWVIVLLSIFLSAILAPFIAPYDPMEQSADLLQPPSADHWVGTDELGRDLFSRIVYGGRISLFVGIVAVSIAVVAGTTLGLLAGYLGEPIDNIIMRLIDALMAFPHILLVILIMAVLGTSVINLMIAVGISSVPWYARTARGTTLTLKETDFVEAARAMGAPNVRILVRHILPNISAPIIVLATVGIATAIISIAGLSFLGLGARPPSPEWGAMLSTARTYMGRASWYATFPGLAILFTVLSINIIGDALRDILDPRLRGTLGGQSKQAKE